MECGCVKNDQFGYCLKAGPRKLAGLGIRKEGMNKMSATHMKVKGTGQEVSIGQEGEVSGGSTILKDGSEVRGEPVSTRGDEKVVRAAKTVEVGESAVIIGEGGIPQHNSSREVNSGHSEGCRAHYSCQRPDMR